MADIELRAHGDGSGAHDALEHVGEGAGHAHEHVTGLQGAMHELGEELGKTMVSANLFSAAIEKGIEFLKEFAAESVKAYAEQEKADRNLALMAGNLTSQLKEQAEEFEKVYGVAATVTEKVQTLALAHGADRDQVVELTEATTKWAAITGTDAASAAENLVRAVESGRHSSKNLGIQWQETGDKAEDLKNAIEALNGKLAGADPTADATLEGRTNKAKLAMEGLQKSFGSWVANVEKNTGVLDKLAGALDTIRQKAGAKGVGAYLGMAAYGPVGAIAGYGAGALGSDSPIADAPAPTHFADTEGDTEAVNKKFDDAVKKAQEARAKLVDNQKTFTQEEDQFDTELEMKNAESLNRRWEAAVQNEEKTQKLSEDSAEKRAAIDELAADDELARQQKQQALELAGQDKFQQDMLESWTRFNEHKQELQEQHDKKMLKLEEETAKKAVTDLVNIGTQALEAALNDPQSIKWQKIVGQIAQAGLTIAGYAIGAAASESPIGGEIGGEIGSLAGIAANYGINQVKHEGGMVERYHRGGFPGRLGPNEVPIIAEGGEYVASKREVAAAGGPGGVRAKLAGGGGGMQVTIQTMDAASMRDTFEGRGSRALVNAMRIGRGSLPKLLSGAK